MSVVLSAALVAVSSLVGLATSSAPAAAGPPASPVLSAEPLPTWQTNGIVWAVEQVGGVVYAGGNFTSVRPPGAKPGTGEVPRKNLAAFDAKTGALLPFSHSFTAPTFTSTAPDTSCTVNWNAPSPYPVTCDTVWEIRKSPDGTKIYVGGDFTTVDGAAHSRLVAFNTANAVTDNLDLDAGFAPTGVNGRIRSLAVSSTTVYTGGLFTAVGTATRNRLAAYNRLTGQLLAWAPSADKIVTAMVMAPDSSRVILGGEFDTVNGTAIHALAPVSSTTGLLTTWNTRPIPAASVVTDLVTDADTVYASAEGNGSGVFDGRLAADPYTGAVRWMDTCLGATWAVELMGDVLYSGSHGHNCSATDGGFPEQGGYRYYRFIAESARSGAPTIQHWFPTSNGGDPNLPVNHTPARLGPRDLTTDGTYLWAGGQFTTVNGRPQQGLTRFTYRPAKSATPRAPTAPVTTTVNATSTRVSWTATEDLDNANLTYRLYRGNTLVTTVGKSSKPWFRPSMSFVDTGLSPGASYAYTVTATDPDSNVSTSVATSAVAGAANPAYPGRVLADGANLYWRLGDTEDNRPTVADLVGPGGDYGSGATLSRSSGVPTQPGDNSADFNGTLFARTVATQAVAAPQRFTLELWLKTTSNLGGKIAGFGNSPNHFDSTAYDRHIYMNATGNLVFGVYSGGAQIIKSPLTYRNGVWHHVVATLGADGMKLYVDGALVASKSTVTSAVNYTGYWRLGGDITNGWPEQRWRHDLLATVDDFSVYPTALTAAQVVAHLKAGRP